MSTLSIDLYRHVLETLAELTESVDDYLDWAATPGDDECPEAIIERLCAAHESAQELLTGLGFGETPS
jgi:hypothetical protein